MKLAEPFQTTPGPVRTFTEWTTALVDWAASVTSSRLPVLAAFTLLYLIPTLRIVRLKMLWTDEFFTLYLSRTSASQLLRALATGADQHPPAFYLQTHALMAVFGTSPVILRLPAILGFWLLCVCLYEAGRALTTPIWAVVAMLFPLSTPLYYYAAEARGYGPLAGWSALALLCWMHASAFHRRKLYLPLLGFSVIATLCSHYYGLLVLGCLGLAEAVRTLCRRKSDLPVWGALACGLMPLILFAGSIRAARNYSGHNWAVPYWADALLFYPEQIGLGFVVLFSTLLVSIFIVGGGAAGTSRRESASAHRVSLTPWQATAIGSLSALPIVAMLLAKTVTHAFNARYAIPALVGVSVGVVCVCSWKAARPRIAIAAIMTCLLMFAIQANRLKLTAIHDREELVADILHLSHRGDEQVAIAESGLFYRLSFYAPRELAARLDYLPDPAYAIEFLGFDTVDRGMLDLRPWFPLKVIPVTSFLENHRRFLVYDSWSWTWLAHKLPDWGDAALVASYGNNRLYAVDNVRVPQSAGRDAHPEPLPELYRSLPETGASLCDLYMRPATCLKFQDPRDGHP